MLTENTCRNSADTVLIYKSGVIEAQLDKTKKKLVSDVCFEIKKNETIALVGETGSGKTMVALSIMKLLPSNVSADNNSIIFNGKDLSAEKNITPILGVNIVYIPQNGLEFLDPSKKIKFHLYDNLKKIGVTNKDLPAAAVAKLSLAGFNDPQDIMNKYPFQLSGGMAQRVTIALAACSNAKLVIADEPTNGLDYEAKNKFMELLKSLFPNAGKLLITHDITIAELCDEVIVLCGGRIMEKGPSNDVLSRPHHPYSKALIASLVKNGMRVFADA